MFANLDIITQTRLFNIVTQWGSILSLIEKRMDQLLEQADSRMEILISNHTTDTKAIHSAWRCLSNHLVDIKQEATDDYNSSARALFALIQANESLGHNVRELKQLALTWTKQYDSLLLDMEISYNELKNQKDIIWAEKLLSCNPQKRPTRRRQVRPTRPLSPLKNMRLPETFEVEGNPGSPFSREPSA